MRTRSKKQDASPTTRAVAGDVASTSASTSKKRRRRNERKTASVENVKQNEKKQKQKKKRGLPDKLWEKILGSVDDNSVTAFACVSKQLRRVQQASGRRLKTNLSPYCYDYEEGEGPPEGVKSSAVSEDWCLWYVKHFSDSMDSEIRLHGIRRSLCIFASAAAFWGHINALKLMRGKCSMFCSQTCAFAAFGGCLDVLKWLKKIYCPWDFYTCEAAARGGHLEVLKYAHEHECAWNKYTCHLAAEGGHLEALKYAHENGCPWDTWTCDLAADGGHLEVLKYARDNGCPEA